MDINIGKRISNLRTSKGYSVNYLANQAGVSQSYLREIEMGHYENPKFHKFFICKPQSIFHFFFQPQKYPF